MWGKKALFVGKYEKRITPNSLQMKKLKYLPVLINVLMQTHVLAQIKPPADDTIFSNNVSARFAADGLLDWNEKTGLAVYRVPKKGDASPIYCGALWIGGIDAGGQLHTAAATYRQNGYDFWPGPIMDSAKYSSHWDTVWNKLYVVNKSTVDSLKAGFYAGKVPKSILDWPGNGDPALGEMQQLAPYYDGNKNGYYDPDGSPTTDYPLIRGDQAMYMVYNDGRVSKHTESGGLKFGVEVHLMAYQFISTDTAVNNTVFMHYDIYNRSNNIYDSVYMANFVDMDLGNGGDDYVGCDTLNNFWYTYNGEAEDPNGTGPYGGEPGYLWHPPAEAVVYLCDTMKHFMSYNNDFTGHGNPINAREYYSYMKSIWADSLHLKYDSTTANTNYAFPGNPVRGAGWSEVSAKDPYGDRRGISSIGPFTFAPGGGKSFDLALVFAQSPDSGGNIQSVALLQKYVPDVKAFYNIQSFGCDSGLLAVNEIKPANEQITVYPNPSNGVFNFVIVRSEVTKQSQYLIRVSNMLGQEVYKSPLSIVNRQFSINLQGQPSGLYIYRIISPNGECIANGKMVLSEK